MKFIIFCICFAFLEGNINAARRFRRIIGGQDAYIRDFPHQASIRLQGDHICGGCIISDRHILTAAHCITRVKEFVAPYTDVSVTTGTSLSTEVGESHGIHSVVVHPAWIDSDDNSLDNDIAVIRLEDKIHFDGWQQKIDLANKNVVSHSIAILSGWGHTSVTNGENAIWLQQLNMRVLNSVDCQNYHYLQIHKQQICAFHGEGRGSSFGDSGGPLVEDNKVIGILSWITKGQSGSGTVEIFASVYAHRDFIISAMN